MKTRDEFYSEFKKNASTNDVKRIDDKLDGMNKGKIAEIWEKVTLLYKLIKDPNAAWASKAVAIGALIYLISPIDAVPDPIPIAGLADDATVIIGAVTTLAMTLAKYKR